MKFDKQQEAKSFRKDGKSITWIAKQLGVSKGSVSLWVKDLELTIDQKNQLLASQTNNFKYIYNNSKQKQFLSKREENQEIGRNKAKEKDTLHCMGCMLFWAEGTKDKNRIAFTNSDANMLKLFVRFLKETLSIQNDQISMTVNCFLNNENDIAEVINWWITELNLQGARQTKPTIKITNDPILNHGVCRITVFNTELAQQLYGAIQEYGSFTNGMCLENKRSRT
jgi:hypothetical protein